MEANLLFVLLQPLFAFFGKIMAGAIINYQKHCLPSIPSDKHLQKTKKRFTVEY